MTKVVSYSHQDILKVLLPATVIIIGMIVTNGGNQYYTTNTRSTIIAGAFMFTMGWISLMYGIVTQSNKFVKGKRSNLLITASVIIVLSFVCITYIIPKAAIHTPWIVAFGMMFTCGWILLGYAISIDRPQRSQGLGLGAAIAIILSILVFLPLQRRRSIVDGPGMALFAVGWGLMAAANGSV
jgi:hypothetical protein